MLQPGRFPPHALAALVAVGLLVAARQPALGAAIATSYRMVSIAPHAATTAINGQGDVVGWVETSPGALRGFRWSSQAGLQLLARVGQADQPTGVNEAGMVVGVTRENPFGATAGVAWNADGAATRVEDAAAFLGVNDGGVIVGTQTGQAAIWRGNGVEAYQNDAQFHDINAVEQIVGNDAAGGYRFDPTVRDTTRLDGSAGLPFANAINDAGIVVGSVTLAGRRAAYWDVSGDVHVLAPPTLGLSVANAINASGVIVGRSDAGAWIFDGSALTLLDELVMNDAGWRLVEASAINDRGEIAVVAERDGVLHAALLNPVPEPSGVCMLVAGLVARRAWR